MSGTTKDAEDVANEAGKAASAKSDDMPSIALHCAMTLRGSAPRPRSCFLDRATRNPARSSHASPKAQSRAAPEYLTEAEVEALMSAAKTNRQDHRDATMLLVAYRHDLRASEVCDCAGTRSISSGPPSCLRRANRRHQ
jgi:hypothetical protein